MKIEAALREKLTAHLQPTELELVNESPMHGLKPEAEKHFRVVAVSEAFAGLSRIERHRLVHETVAVELQTHVHALSVQAYTPEEWAKKNGETFASPECLGGGKRERG
jgi:stress-induced morphogen